MPYLEFVIREADVSDAVGIAIVQAYTWLTTYRGLMPDSALDARVDGVPAQAEYIERRIGEEDAYFVAEFKGAVVGFAVCSASRDENYPQDGEIQALYLLRGFQEKGIGAALFSRCAEHIRKKGADHLIVNCLEGNQTMGFYEHMGGVIVGTREDMISGGHMIREYVLRFQLDRIIGKEAVK